MFSESFMSSDRVVVVVVVFCVCLFVCCLFLFGQLLWP